MAHETPNSTPDLFEDFWILYWRKEAKKDARVAWSKIDPKHYAEIVTAVCSWRRFFLARGDTRFIPLPATWLNGERWTDELPVELRSPVAAHQPASMPDLPRKSGEIPQHVRDQLAKLRRC
jgi:hypothetical protein